HGGAERVITAAARALPAQGLVPGVVLLAEGPLEDWLHAAGVPYRVLRAPRTRQVHRAVPAVVRLSREWRRTGTDVVLSSLPKGHLYGGLAARLAGVPEVRWQHTFPGRSWFDRLADRVPAAATICVSHAVADRMKDPTEVVLPGIELAEVRSREGSGRAIRDRLVPPGGWLVGVVSRVHRGKGLETFVEAAALVSARTPGARFVAVGGPHDAASEGLARQLRARAERLGSTMTFAGHQPDVFPWIDSLDLLVAPSTVEAFGLSVLEALALGTPVVATDSGGPAEIIGGSGAGCIVAVDEAGAMAAAISELLADPARRARMSELARARAGELSVEAMAAGLATTLRRAARAGPRRRSWRAGGRDGRRRG
ncbi:MAG TPA: glycosyltransferase family 4 protein, partial [Acidimicrobiales bacterium]